MPKMEFVLAPLRVVYKEQKKFSGWAVHHQFKTSDAHYFHLSFSLSLSSFLSHFVIRVARESYTNHSFLSILFSVNAMTLKLLVLSSLALLTNAHMAAYHKSMYCFNVSLALLLA
jgi:hypothetical protein